MGVPFIINGDSFYYKYGWWLLVSESSFFKMRIYQMGEIFKQTSNIDK